MSDRHRTAGAAHAPARRLALGALAGGRGGFARDLRFGLPGPDGGGQAEDPATLAFAEGYARGAEDARAAALAEVAAQDAARHRIETALARMDDEALRAFRQRLTECVLALCEAAVAPAAIDPAGLAARVSRAAAMFARAADERVIRLHPEDLALVHARLPEDWHCEPDPALERGTIRIEGPDGGVEDGPTQWRRALDEALRQC